MPFARLLSSGGDGSSSGGGGVPPPPTQRSASIHLTFDYNFEFNIQTKCPIWIAHKFSAMQLKYNDDNGLPLE